MEDTNQDKILPLSDRIALDIYSAYREMNNILSILHTSRNKAEIQLSYREFRKKFIQFYSVMKNKQMERVNTKERQFISFYLRQPNKITDIEIASKIEHISSQLIEASGISDIAQKTEIDLDFI